MYKSTSCLDWRVQYGSRFKLFGWEDKNQQARDIIRSFFFLFCTETKRNGVCRRDLASCYWDLAQRNQWDRLVFVSYSQRDTGWIFNAAFEFTFPTRNRTIYWLRHNDWSRFLLCTYGFSISKAAYRSRAASISFKEDSFSHHLRFRFSPSGSSPSHCAGCWPLSSTAAQGGSWDTSQRRTKWTWSWTLITF